MQKYVGATKNIGWCKMGHCAQETAIILCQMPTNFHKFFTYQTQQ